MGDFLDILNELGASDQIPSRLYDGITGQIRRISEILENEEPQPVQS
jgi:type IV secretion system protein VirD4